MHVPVGRLRVDADAQVDAVEAAERDRAPRRRRRRGRSARPRRPARASQAAVFAPAPPGRSEIRAGVSLRDRQRRVVEGHDVEHHLAEDDDHCAPRSPPPARRCAARAGRSRAATRRSSARWKRSSRNGVTSRPRDALLGRRLEPFAQQRGRAARRPSARRAGWRPRPRRARRRARARAQHRRDLLPASPPATCTGSPDEVR